MQLLAREVIAEYCAPLPGSVTALMLKNYMRAGTLHKYNIYIYIYIYIYTHGRYNTPTTCSLYMMIFMASNVIGVTRTGNIAHRSGIELTSLAFQASLLNVTPQTHQISLHYPSTWVRPTPSLIGQYICQFQVCRWCFRKELYSHIHEELLPQTLSLNLALTLETHLLE